MFEKATKKQSRLRLALVGPSGSGKTYSALAIATGLGKRIGLIDTERGSAAKYAELFNFDTLQLETFHPQRYIEAIQEAEKSGYDVLIIDSLSHAWIGKDGALELVDAAARRSKTGSSFAAWREVTPIQNMLVDAIVGSKLHIVATLRVKTEYTVDRDEKTGKSIPRKVGLSPVQRDGFEFEFDIIGELDSEVMTVTKSRCPALSGTVTRRPGAEFGKLLATWLSDGAVVPASATGSNGSIESLPPIEQTRIMLEQARSEADLKALLPRIRALAVADQAKLRDRYAARRQELAHHAAPNGK